MVGIVKIKAWFLKAVGASLFAMGFGLLFGTGVQSIASNFTDVSWVPWLALALMAFLGAFVGQWTANVARRDGGEDLATFSASMGTCTAFLLALLALFIEEPAGFFLAQSVALLAVISLLALSYRAPDTSLLSSGAAIGVVAYGLSASAVALGWNAMAIALLGYFVLAAGGLVAFQADLIQTVENDRLRTLHSKPALEK